MPRNISFSLTTDSIRDRTKTVTRRLGWKKLKAGDVLNACVKCMGLKPGEKIERICQIRVVGVRQEPLCSITNEPNGAAKEGFPLLSESAFVLMFCEHMRCTPETVVTRIEFEYLAPTD